MKMIQTADLEIPELEIYTRLNERQVKTLFEPDEGVFICESEKVIGRALKAGYEPLSALCEESRLAEVQAMAGQYDIPVYAAAYDRMRSVTGYSLTGGILMAMRRKPLRDVEDILRHSERIVVLDDVENPTNVGAIFRSAAALGADAVLLTAGCADPLYRRAARVSMGSVFQIAWTFVDGTVVEKLKARGFETFALALAENAEKLDEISSCVFRKAVILGNEDHGISDRILADCDHCVMIPMQNGVDSLNVAAASAVAFWEILSDRD
ncbi:MAG: RNA methyltransferase [Lachnospiraceae bacterium]|nr:RNA methyltransferase [Lachnospiraceae bacterium]